MKTSTSKPWLDQDRKIFSDEKLKAISKDWSPETWEEFLNSTVESEPSDHEVDTTNEYDDVCKKETEGLWNRHKLLPLPVQQEIETAVKKLKKRPRKVIRLHYWENKSIRTIAKIEDLAPSRIHKIKANSLGLIKELLENSVNTPSYLIGGSQKMNPQHLSREEQILEVYLKDLNGSYLK
ncbi:MAG TPA: sigma factor-like helix-turn-helix DNA-binding protein [Bdellovibrio sp.]|uniref:sigma factor-like helix-turn-helix DNA-binding protein n=1 Tax=Bdellovibrio sp. TaxID=28201 RepID=UPI002EFE73EC